MVFKSEKKHLSSATSLTSCIHMREEVHKEGLKENKKEIDWESSIPVQILYLHKRIKLRQQMLFKNTQNKVSRITKVHSNTHSYMIHTLY